MNYIRDLYNKSPEIVKKFIQREFQPNKYEKIVEHTEEDEFLKTDEYVELFVGLGGGRYQVIILEDFAISCNGEYIEIGDKRIDTYLKLMAKIYGDKYITEFEGYRNSERNDWVDAFDSMTTSIKEEMLEVAKKQKEKKVQQNKETNNF